MMLFCELCAVVAVCVHCQPDNSSPESSTFNKK